MSNNEIVAGFLLNSMMKLIPALYDIRKLNKNKKIFQEEGIISKGFVIKMVPKIKSYYRFTT